MAWFGMMIQVCCYYENHGMIRYFFAALCCDCKVLTMHGLLYTTILQNHASIYRAAYRKCGWGGKTEGILETLSDQFWGIWFVEGHVSSTKGIYAFLSTIRILGSACVTVVRTADNRNGQLAVTFFVSFSGSVLDVNTATTALEVDSYTFFPINPYTPVSGKNVNLRTLINPYS